MAREQNNLGFQSSQAVLFLEKHDELSNPMNFGQKLSYFTDQNGHEHEDEFLTILKFRNECYRQSGKDRWKMISFVQFPCSLPELWSLTFLQFCPDLSKKFKSH